MSNDDVALVKRFLFGGSKEYPLHIAPDCVVHEADSLWYGGDWTGPEGLAAMQKTLGSKVRFKLNDLTLRDAGDVVQVSMSLTFTSLVNGRTLETSINELYRTKDGKIVEISPYYHDTAALLELIRED